MRKYFFSIFLSSLVRASFSWAGLCEITIDRKACPGKETEAFQPYNGVNPTHELKKLNNAAVCEKWAEKCMKIVRRGMLAEKIIHIRFDGKDLDKVFVDRVVCK